MPTYLYKCATHGEFEESHSIKEKLTECPLCKKENIEPPKEVIRLISPGGTFVLMRGGSGWASNGYS